jgi:hypothetical protein
MYAGAGSGPLMAAATAYANLSAEVSSTASQWESIISLLTTEQWTGGGSAAAAAAAQPIVSYLTTTAAALEQARLERRLVRVKGEDEGGRADGALEVDGLVERARVAVEEEVVRVALVHRGAHELEHELLARLVGECSPNRM